MKLVGRNKKSRNALKRLELKHNEYTLYSFMHFSKIQQYNNGCKPLEISFNIITITPAFKTNSILNMIKPADITFPTTSAA